MKKIILIAFVLLITLPVQAEDRLCPDLETLLKQTPETMVGVQADIDRMKLCVERAKLLKELDDIALKRKEILNKINSNEGALSAMPVPIPMLPASALSPVGDVPEQPPASPQPAATWNVRKIWGQESGMSAQLSDGKGNVLNVVRGDLLPNGMAIESVTANGVSVSLNGKINSLDWEQVAQTEVQ
jgi:type IV pilus biogenesis protein PilP